MTNTHTRTRKNTFLVIAPVGAQELHIMDPRGGRNTQAEKQRKKKWGNVSQYACMLACSLLVSYGNMPSRIEHNLPPPPPTPSGISLSGLILFAPHSSVGLQSLFCGGAAALHWHLIISSGAEGQRLQIPQMQS